MFAAISWDKSYIVVKIAENPFSRGSLRVSYYCLDLTENEKKRSHTMALSVSLNANRHTPKSLISPTDSLSTNIIISSDKIGIKGYHSRSNGNLRASRSGMDRVGPKNKSISSMSVPAEVALGQGQLTVVDQDNLPFPYFSASLAGILCMDFK